METFGDGLNDMPSTGPTGCRVLASQAGKKVTKINYPSSLYTLTTE